MTDVDLITYCCPKDVHKIHAPGMLEAMVESHSYSFKNVFVVQQNCRGLDLLPFKTECTILETEDFPGIRPEFGIPEDDVVAESLTLPGSKYYWKNHCQNQLIGLKMATTEYVAFSDCDILVKGATAGSWVTEGIRILKSNRNVLMVSPGHGQPGQESDVVSQIAFVCELERMKAIDFDLDKGLSPGPFDFVFEGRIQRYIRTHGLKRYLLGPEWGVIFHYAW